MEALRVYAGEVLPWILLRKRAFCLIVQRGINKMTAYRAATFGFIFLLSVTAISLTSGQENLPAIIKKIEPSIVVVLTYNKEGAILGQGSGFFISRDGDVITNRHVLQGANRAEVRTSDGRVYPIMRVLAEDKEGDLIRMSVGIPKDAAQPLPISSSFPEVGERILVIGTPFGLERTVSEGIVSAVREVLELGKIIQVTAPISSGSSGSPVVKLNGEVIGVATFFLMAGQNLNFAIPGQRISRLTPGTGQTLAEREGRREEESITDAAKFYAIGLRYLLAEDCERALPYFIETVKKNSNHAGAYFQIGYCSGNLGRYQGAIAAYRRSIALKPEEAGTHNNLCAAYAKLGHYSEAIETCQQAIRLSSAPAEAYNNLGWSYHQLGRFQEAAEACKEAIRRKPDFALAHYNLGNNYADLRQFEEAIESYKQAIRIKFDYAEAHLNLGAAYNGTGRHEEAIASYRQSIRIKPGLAAAHLNLGMTYLRIGDRGSALEEYKILKDLDSGKEFANKLFNLIYE